MIHVRFIWGVIYIVDKVKLNILILELQRINEHACITEVRNLKSLEGTGVYSVQLLTLFIHFTLFFLSRTCSITFAEKR